MTVIVILAMIFALLALRLFAVLGRRTGTEQRQLPIPADDRSSLAPRPVAPSQGDARSEGAREQDSVVSVPAQSGLRALIALDRSFDVGQFLVGARAAYGMILEAYWNGDRETLRRYCDPEVLGAFESAIDAREAAGQTLANRLVRIENANISDVRVENGQAVLTVRFEADISAVTKDKDGAMIAGSLVDAVPTIELWTFARDVRSRDPNWLLVETDGGLSAGSESGLMMFHRLRLFLNVPRRVAPGPLAALCAALALAGCTVIPSGGGRPAPAARPIPSTPRPTLPAPTAPTPTPTPGATPTPSGPPPAIAAGLVPAPGLDSLLPTDSPRTALALRAFRASCPSLLRRTDGSGLTNGSDWQAACSAAASWSEDNGPQFLPALFRGRPARRRQDLCDRLFRAGNPRLPREGAGLRDAALQAPGRSHRSRSRPVQRQPQRPAHSRQGQGQQLHSL